jgi:hypothetical protein
LTVTSNIHLGLTAWVASTSFVFGNRRSNGGNAYVCVANGTSAGSGGPTGTGSNIVDNTCRWSYLSAIDYSSIALWQASIPTTLTQPIVGQLWNDGEIAASPTGPGWLTLTGHTTTTTNTITLTAAPGESFVDSIHQTPQASALAYNSGAGVAVNFTGNSGFLNLIDITDANVTISRIQFVDHNTTDEVTMVEGEVGSKNLVLDQCIFDGCAQTGGAIILDFQDTGMIMRNCLFIDRQPASPGGQIPFHFGSSSTGNVVASTLIGVNNPALTAGFVSDNATIGSILARDLVVFGFPNGLVGNGGSGLVLIDHCSFTGSAIGANTTDNGGNLLSQVASSNIVSAYTDMRALTSGALKNAGATDAVNVPAKVDIANNPRPQYTSWTIGAMETFKPFATRPRSPIRLRM